MLSIILMLMFAAVPFVLLLWWLDTLIKRAQQREKNHWYRNPPGPRGFEVKLTTGEPPVPQKKNL
jgi:hypothetical protein